MRSHYPLLLLLLSLPICGWAQAVITVPKISADITLDGEPNETAWEQALTLDAFQQIEPNLGAPATEHVVVKVMYDEQYLYVAGVCTYADPSQLFAATLERDVPQLNDDYLEIHLDTYNDRINTLVFRTNPLSARQDFEISRNGEDFNTSWNTFWSAQSQRQASGWSTEMRIPFSSLRYQKGAENTMRLKAIINYKEKGERIISPLHNTEVALAAYHFDNSQEVRFQNLPAAKPLYITPYVKANVLRQNVLDTDETAYHSQTTFLERKHYVNPAALDQGLSNLGLDVKFRPKANHTLDLTLNTDFAEVEADDRIVNISRFPIFLPEKRLFFLENADLFNSDRFDHRLFHSRRIGIQDGAAVPIIGGVRYTGSTAQWQYGALSMQTHRTEEVPAAHNMSVARIRKTIGNKGSNIGLINTNKLHADDYNHLLGLDANIRFTDNIRTALTLASTFDPETGHWKPMYGVEVTTFKNNGFGINYRFREYTEDFNPELGFVSRPNTKRLVLNNGWRKTYTNSSFLRFLTVGSYINKFWKSASGLPEFFQTNLYFTAIHNKGHRLIIFAPIYQEDNLYQDWEISEGVFIPTGHYQMWKVNPIFISGRAQRYRLIVDTEIGDFYGGRQVTVFSNLTYDFNKFFKAEWGVTFNRLRLPSSYASDTSTKLNLSRYFTRLRFNFSAKTSFNTYIQYDTRANKAGFNLRFRYNPLEGTDLYLVYNHQVNTLRTALNPRLPLTENQVWVVKFSTTFLR